MASIKKAKANLDLVTGGKDFPWLFGIVLKIASIDKPEYIAARVDALRKYEREYRTGSLTAEQVNDAVKECVAEHILVGWSGVTDDETGETIPYSKEEALKYFNDPELFEFYDFVVAKATERANFRREMNEINAGN